MGTGKRCHRWALGWTVTTAIGVDPDDRWANPGLSGAATITLLLGAVLWVLARAGLARPHVRVNVEVAALPQEDDE